jgi:hypothetical protein
MILLSRGSRSVALLFLSSLAFMTGCQNPKYAGYEPTSRSFYEDPDVNQCYIGVDLSFTLDNPQRHWHKAAATITSTDP